jgi:MFS family permease
MEGRGFTLESAALLGSTYYISIGVSRIAIGFLLDRFPPTMISAAAVALSAVGAVLLLFSGQNPSVSFATLAVAMIGLAHGAESDFIAFFIHRYFGLRNYTLLFGIYGGLMTGGGFALGGLVFAALYDHFGNYQAAIATSAAGFAIASVLMIVIGVVDGAMRRKRTTI